MSKHASAPPAPSADTPQADMPGGKVGLILEAAHHIFLEQGYGNTSMDAVAKRAGVSKATLYVHFENKEQLFAEVVTRARAGVKRVIAVIAEEERDDPAETLRLIGWAFLQFVTTPGVLTLFRAVIGETQRFPALGATIHQAGSNDMLAVIAGAIARATDRGLLAVPDPMMAAAQFIALTKSDLHLRCLLDPEFRAGAADIERNLEAAVAMFMSHYGPKRP